MCVGHDAYQFEGGTGYVYCSDTASNDKCYDVCFSASADNCKHQPFIGRNQRDMIRLATVALGLAGILFCSCLLRGIVRLVAFYLKVFRDMYGVHLLVEKRVLKLIVGE